jgi:Carboxypeptidase regulatory-like domain
MFFEAGNPIAGTGGSMSTHLHKCLGLAFLALLSCAALVAQVTADATLTGVVKDTSGAVVSDAQVRLESVETRAIRETRTNGEGEYRFDLVAPGAYKVTISVSGFQTKVINNIILAVGQTVTNNATLAVGQQTETIMVEVSSPLINVEKTDDG